MDILAFLSRISLCRLSCQDQWESKYMIVLINWIITYFKGCNCNFLWGKARVICLLWAQLPCHGFEGSNPIQSYLLPIINNQICKCQCQDLVFGNVNEILASRQQVPCCDSDTPLKFHTAELGEKVNDYAKVIQMKNCDFFDIPTYLSIFQF